MEKYFRTKFCVSIVQEGVLIKYFQLIVKICSKFCSGRTVSPALLLLLSRTCLDLHTNTTGHLASIMADQYQLLEVANMTQVNTSLASVSQSLLDTYVKVQAADLSPSQMSGGSQWGNWVLIYHAFHFMIKITSFH